MDVTEQELRKRYKSLETEELIELYRKNEFTDLASAVLAQILEERGVSLEDLTKFSVVEGKKAEPSQEDASLSFLDLTEYTKHYESIETEELIELYRKSELTHLASAAIAQVLEERGISTEILDEELFDMENQVESTTHVIPIEFTGNAGEYFRIWIVNVFLSLITLGIYSAWAKVRNRRYLYGNTLVESIPLEYLAQPKQILKGRLIAFSVLAICGVTIHFVPVANKFFWIAFMFLYPWVFIRARSFNLRNSSYRNIRFKFRAGYGGAFAVLVGFPVIFGVIAFAIYVAFASILHSGLCIIIYVLICIPLIAIYAQNIKEFQVKHSRYGMTPFTFGAETKSFYAIYFKAGGLLVLGTIAALVLYKPIYSSLYKLTAADTAMNQEAVRQFALAIFMVPLFLLIRAYARTLVTNVVWNNTVLEKHRFESTLKPSRIIWIAFSNIVAILFSLGLLIPWAKIRLARYRLENLKLLATGNLDGFIADEHEKVGAAGEEIADFFDFDFWI